MKHINKPWSLLLIFFGVACLLSACNSSTKAPDIKLPDMAPTQAINEDKPSPELAKEAEAKPEKKPEVEEKKPEDTGPKCASTWAEMSSLAPIQGLPNLPSLVSQGQASFQTGDGKSYRLLNQGGNIVVSTPDKGDHVAPSICKTATGALHAKVNVMFMTVDVFITPKTNKAFNIKVLDTEVEATIQ